MRGGEAGAFKATPPDGAHLWPSWTSPVPSEPRTHPPLPVTGLHIKLAQRIRAWIRLLAMVFTLHLQGKKKVQEMEQKFKSPCPPGGEPLLAS